MMDATALALLISTGAMALIGIIKQVESSRCSRIKCCGIQCDREVISEEAFEQPNPMARPSTFDKAAAQKK